MISPSCSPRWRPRGGWARTVLLALTAWGVVLSVETLFRQPGFGRHLALPDRLERAGRHYLRSPAARDPGRPPEGLTLLAQADYREPGVATGDPIRLRLLTLASTGMGVSMPVKAIGPSLLGEGSQGSCVILDRKGQPLTRLSTEAEWQEWMARRRPGPGGLVAWLAGLRPYRANTCLWESQP